MILILIYIFLTWFCFSSVTCEPTQLKTLFYDGIAVIDPFTGEFNITSRQPLYEPQMSGVYCVDSTSKILWYTPRNKLLIGAYTNGTGNLNDFEIVISTSYQIVTLAFDTKRQRVLICHTDGTIGTVEFLKTYSVLNKVRIPGVPGEIGFYDSVTDTFQIGWISTEGDYEWITYDCSSNTVISIPIAESYIVYGGVEYTPGSYVGYTSNLTLVDWNVTQNSRRTITKFHPTTMFMEAGMAYLNSTVYFLTARNEYENEWWLKTVNVKTSAMDKMKLCPGNEECSWFLWSE